MTYDDLPQAIKATVGEQEFLWLSDEEKSNLINDITTPDFEADC